MSDPRATMEGGAPPRYVASEMKAEEGTWTPRERHALLSRLQSALRDMDDASHFLDHNVGRWAIRADLEEALGYLGKSRSKVSGLITRVRAVSTDAVAERHNA